MTNGQQVNYTLEKMGLVGLYLFMAVATTYPLVLYLTTGIPDDGGDAKVFMWNYWWFDKAIFELGTNPFITDYIFYPEGINLTMHTVNLFNVLTGIVLNKFVDNIILVHNLLLLFSITLAAYGANRLVFYETGSKVGALIGGIVFGFSPYFFSHFGGHFNLTSIQFIPFYVLYLLKIVREPEIKYKNSIIAGVFLILTGLADYYYLVYLILFSLGLAMYLFVKDRPLVLNKDFLKRAIILIFTFVVGFAPIIYNTALMYIRGENVPLEGWGGANNNVIDLLAFITPSPFHPIFKPLVAPIYDMFSGGVVEGTAFLGYTAIVLAGLAIVKLRKREPLVKMWTLFMASFMVLSMGLSLHVLGRFYLTETAGIKIAVPLPYIIIHYIPILQNARVPSRFTVMTMLCLAVLVGYGFRYWTANFSKNRRKVAGLLIASLLLFEYFPAPYQVRNLDVPQFYHELAELKQEGTVLEIPLGWRDGFKMVGSMRVESQFYQTVHNIPLVNGYVARFPREKMDLYFQYPTIRDIVQLEVSPQEVGVLPDKQEALKLAKDFNIRFIVIHKDHVSGELRAFVEEAFSVKKVYENEQLAAYKIMGH